MSKIFARKMFLTELKLYPKDYDNFLRMDEETYLKLLSLVSHCEGLNGLNSADSYTLSFLPDVMPK